MARKKERAAAMNRVVSERKSRAGKDTHTSGLYVRSKRPDGRGERDYEDEVDASVVTHGKATAKPVTLPTLTFLDPKNKREGKWIK